MATTRKSKGKAARRTIGAAKKAVRGARREARRREPAAPGTRRPPASKAAALAPSAQPSLTPAHPDVARPTALAVARAGLDKKAEDVTVLDVRGLASYADYFVIMTADSDRQASAVADHVEQTMKKSGVAKVGVEGYGGSWILVDYGDVVAHVMSSESRTHYDLEGLWADAPRFRVRD
ncbi:MAG TPA: ribosome silencing factor [Anaeromyxobacteraceae bacterium]|nr:ribosome silencing factor [Anaeromyxobacteraceae bacterium]